MSDRATKEGKVQRVYYVAIGEGGSLVSPVLLLWENWMLTALTAIIVDGRFHSL